MHNFDREIEDYRSNNISMKILNQLLQDASTTDRYKIQKINRLSLEITVGLILKKKEMLEGHNGMKGEYDNNKEPMLC